MKYDAILVPGRGISEDGSLNEWGEACVRKAVDLFNGGCADHIIFSGKWSYKNDYTPPVTEAEAMAQYATDKLGLPKDVIVIENESVSTVTNLIHSKKILETNNWKSLIALYVDPFKERMIINMDKVLGGGYSYALIKADFEFEKEKLKQLQAIEQDKVASASRFLDQFEPGDDQSIYEEVKKFHEKLGQQI